LTILLSLAAVVVGTLALAQAALELAQGFQ
jgi:hypothetical protein